jgi:diketogulonate reductase-like aldo/keto reductase
MNRRDSLRMAGLSLAASALPGWAASPSPAPPDMAKPPAASGLLRRQIPRTGQAVAAVGMGTWLTFNVAPGDALALRQRREVLQRFFAAGGQLIDSSPMYGSAEEALGLLLPQAGTAGTPPGGLFSATKVWTPLTAYGRTQMQRSLALWGLPGVDLMQGHNLLNWAGHLSTLRALQAEGRIRHLGVNTSHGNKHAAMREVLQAVSERQPLPAVAADLGCSSWAALVLKWELAHPAVSVAIPATTQPAHMDENMAALHGPLPDRWQREEIGRVFERLLG